MKTDHGFVYERPVALMNRMHELHDAIQRTPTAVRDALWATFYGGQAAVCTAVSDPIYAGYYATMAASSAHRVLAALDEAAGID